MVTHDFLIVLLHSDNLSMSKPKNIVMCPDCGRFKMFFETEAKTMNFIKTLSK